MKTAGREVEPWRVPVLALRALERQLSAQPEQFTVALAAEKLLALLTPDVAAMEVSPLSGLAGVAEKARSEVAPERARTSRTREKAALPASAPSTGSTNRFANVSNVIGEALQRGAAVMGNAAQTGSGIGRAISGDSRSGADGKSLGVIGKALAGAVALPVDPARRGRDASVVPIDRKQGATTDSDAGAKKSPFATAALAAMEALSKATSDQSATPEAAARKGQGSALETGLDAIQRVGELAGKVIEAGTEQLARPKGGFIEALAKGAATGAGRGAGSGQAAAPTTTLGRVDQLATDLLARGIASGAARGAGEALAAGADPSHRTAATPEGAQAVAPKAVTAPTPALAPTVAPAPLPTAPTATAAAALPDAASLTALVNEVLMEQARRHGVDLT